jgi:hypothetical protein
MKRATINQWFGSAVGLSLLLLWPVNLGSGKQIPRNKTDLDLVSYCDLVSNPEKFEGKEVTVRASYRYGFEWQELFCLECRKVGKTWLEFGDDFTHESRVGLKRFPKSQGTINAVFTGIFHSSKGSYGDGSYRFQLMLRVITHAELVSENGGILTAYHQVPGKRFAARASALPRLFLKSGALQIIQIL